MLRPGTLREELLYDYQESLHDSHREEARQLPCSYCHPQAH